MKKSNQLLLFQILFFLVILNVNAQYAQPKLGYAISPPGFPVTFNQIPSFLSEVSNTCGNGVLLINGDWRDSLSTSGNIPTLQKTLLPLSPSPYNFVDLSVYAWASYPVLHLDNPGNNANNWANTRTRDAFLKMLIHTADSLAPTYLMIGNEVNFYWEQDSVDYANWASFYSKAYDSIKVHSPVTKVGTVFNYEHLSGQGSFQGWNKAYWKALSSMDTSRMDVVGITLYPFLNFKAPDSIPSTYLDPLFNKIGNIPVIFTETGWPADDFGGAWISGTQKQIDYINKLFPMLANRNVEVVDWLFLNYYMAHDNSTFRSVAFRDSTGNDYPALSEWLTHCPSVAGVQNNIHLSTSVSFSPNPMSTAASLKFENPSNESFSLLIYDSKGKLIRTVLNVTSDYISIERKDLIGGLYYFILQSDKSKLTGKFIVD